MLTHVLTLSKQMNHIFHSPLERKVIRKRTEGNKGDARKQVKEK